MSHCNVTSRDEPLKRELSPEPAVTPVSRNILEFLSVTACVFTVFVKSRLKDVFVLPPSGHKMN